MYLLLLPPNMPSTIIFAAAQRYIAGAARFEPIAPIVPRSFVRNSSATK
jgi:hypothetical protein